MSSDDSDDFMSDKFLANLSTKNNSSLIKTAYAKQQHKKLAEQEELRDSQRAARRKREEDKFITKVHKNESLEVERREEGLSTKLPETNKGFQLMAKMGFKTGDSLGKLAEKHAGDFGFKIGFNEKSGEKSEEVENTEDLYDDSWASMVTGSEQPVEIEKIKTTETSSQNGISKRSIIISEQKNSKTVRYTGISPILEPINMDLTRNKRSTAKLGIGIQKHQKDQNLRKRELQMKRIQENAAKQAKLAEQFAENSKRDHEVVMWWNDLKKSQKSCEDLDIRVKKLGTPEFSYRVIF